jgi:carbonic anhydrase/acetyltransferase-like protein (isoleucine patch superfamily)
MIRSFNGKTPKIADSAFVSEAAYVIGDVEIGEGSGIFPGAVIRADFASIKIGRNTMVEDNSVIHSGGPVEIGNNVTIGHSVVVHCSKIGNNNLIGNNATLLDDAEIGSYCIIGAGCLVSQGMKIPDNSFVVGIPAEIKGQVPLERWQRRRSGRSGGGYSDLVRQYKEQGL